MSHELRTPLNSILGFSEILKDNLAGALTDEQRVECLEAIHASGEHLLQLINDVLDMSKIEAGRMDLVLEEFVVDAAFREVLTVVKSLAGRKGIELSILVEPEDLTIYADKGKVKQVLYNLLSNAIKFTPEAGSVFVDGKLRQEAQDLLVSVTDTGVGIPPEHIDKIWGEFYMVQGEHQTQKGTGSAWPWSRSWSSSTAAPSPSPASPARAPRSPSQCRCRPGRSTRPASSSPS